MKLSKSLSHNFLGAILLAVAFMVAVVGLLHPFFFALALVPFLFGIIFMVDLE